MHLRLYDLQLFCLSVHRLYKMLSVDLIYSHKVIKLDQITPNEICFFFVSPRKSCLGFKFCDYWDLGAFCITLTSEA